MIGNLHPNVGRPVKEERFLLQNVDGKQQSAYKESTTSFSSGEIQKSKGTCISIILCPRTRSGGLPLPDGRPQLFTRQLNGNKRSLGSLQQPPLVHDVLRQHWSNSLKTTLKNQAYVRPLTTTTSITNVLNVTNNHFHAFGI